MSPVALESVLRYLGCCQAAQAHQALGEAFASVGQLQQHPGLWSFAAAVLHSFLASVCMCKQSAILMIYPLERRAEMEPQLPLCTALQHLLRVELRAHAQYDVRPYCRYHQLNHERKVKVPGYRATAIYED